MHKIVKVEIPFSESREFQRRYPRADKPGPRPYPTFTTLKDANWFLLGLSQDPSMSDLGYYKTDFRITWDDGQIYEGRYDLHKYPNHQENPSGQVDLADHIRAHCLFYAGDRRPRHMTEEQYAEILRYSAPKEEDRQKYRDFLAEYSLE